MTLIANLVFIEEAVYIYRRIPSFKRSVIIWINAAAPVSYHGKVMKLKVGSLKIHMNQLYLCPWYNPPPFLCR